MQFWLKNYKFLLERQSRKFSTKIPCIDYNFKNINFAMKFIFLDQPPSSPPPPTQTNLCSCESESSAEGSTRPNAQRSWRDYSNSPPDAPQCMKSSISTEFHFSGCSSSNWTTTASTPGSWADCSGEVCEVEANPSAIHVARCRIW